MLEPRLYMHMHQLLKTTIKICRYTATSSSNVYTEPLDQNCLISDRNASFNSEQPFLLHFSGPKNVHMYF